MGRSAAGLICVLLACGGLSGVASAQERPALKAMLETCTTGALPADRVAALGGSMPAVAGATRMSMRFELQRRDIPSADAKTRVAWRRVPGVPGFGRWQRSEPNRAGFVLHKRIDGLAPGAEYRAVVRFRWRASDGTIVRQARRRTRACRQPDMRPDLAPGVLTATPTAVPGTARYSLVVRNAGRSDAGPFAITVAGVATSVTGLAAGDSRTVDVPAPACAPGSRVAVIVDPESRVDEVREDDDRAARACPLGAP